ncbi:MAG: DUF5591 domain-containing protein [Promethearchaeota archaeon]
MNFHYQLKKIQHFAREGTISFNDGKEKFKIHTPLFIPRIHPPLLKVDEYRRFLLDLKKRYGLGAFFAPDVNLEDAGFLTEDHHPAIFTDVYPIYGVEIKDKQLNEHSIPVLRCNVPFRVSDRYLTRVFKEKYMKSVLHFSREHDGQFILFSNDGDPGAWRETEVEVGGSRIQGFGIQYFNFQRDAPDYMVGRTVAMHETIRLDAFRIHDGGSRVHDIPLLVYAGFDAVVENGYLAASRAGKYMMPDGEYDLDSLSRLPCPCSHCKMLEDLMPVGRFNFEVIMQLYFHNVTQAIHAATFARDLIRNDTFRSFVENNSRVSPSRVVYLKKLDGETSLLSSVVDRLDLRCKIPLVGSESYYRPDILRFRTKVKEIFNLPRRTKYLILLPCSAGKPYRFSRSHKKFNASMKRGWKGWEKFCSELIITSPLGLVPRQLDECYPAAHYDVPVTGYWDEQELEFSRDMLVTLVNRAVSDGVPVRGILAHLDGGYRQACEMAVDQLSIPLEFTFDDDIHATSKDALIALEKKVATIGSMFEREGITSTASKKTIILEDLRSLLDFQFETSIGDIVIDHGASTRRLHGGILYVYPPGEKNPLLHQNKDTGYIQLDKAGMGVAWKGFNDGKIKLKTVSFDGEKIRGSNVFPAGITRVSEGIAVGDDIFIQDGCGGLLGYGRAIVPGSRMKEMKRGPVISIIKKL